MHATVTHLRFESHQQVEAAEEALRRIVDGLPATLGLRECYVVESATRELFLFAAYDSEAEADAASASMRPVIADAVGPLVAAVPSRSEGRLVLRRRFARTTSESCGQWEIGVPLGPWLSS